ncbi:hypothetical protein HU200_044281 [Digitaria exilis]|uniref:Uncharacterized protein n=1 Tax=Digitaria exilis TaxID=1010633 RepID=A0A835B1Z2_9POAL|nr:hypothetical protein HU200_044281 [Digitaria exilis]CAB3493799.1 unnamed protein product [Digitaria exilis]
MPSPPKERPSGRLGRLLAALRPSRAGPLPVQTGFPTSLADLVVKNHGRLKKQPSPSSKRGKRGAAVASPSPSPSPSTSPPPASRPPPPPAAAVSPSDRPRPDLPPARPARRGGEGGGGFGLGLGFLAFSGVVSLALLVIWSKKVVAAVTVAAFSLFLLESVRSSLRPRRPRPVVATETPLYLDGRGRVSPIREVDAETEPSRPCCSDTDRGSDEVSILAAGVEKSGALDGSATPTAKTKKRSWKHKLIAGAKKLNKGRKSKEASVDSPCSFRSDGAQSDASVRGGNARAADPSDSGRFVANRMDAAVPEEPESLRGSRRSQGIEIVAAQVEIDAQAAGLLADEEDGEVGRGAGSRFPAALVLVAVALVGLVAGKLPAVALIVLCYAFFSSSVQGLPRGGGGGGGSSPERRLEVPVA